MRIKIGILIILLGSAAFSFSQELKIANDYTTINNPPVNPNVHLKDLGKSAYTADAKFNGLVNFTEVGNKESEGEVPAGNGTNKKVLLYTKLFKFSSPYKLTISSAQNELLKECQISGNEDFYIEYHKDFFGDTRVLSNNIAVGENYFTKVNGFSTEELLEKAYIADKAKFQKAVEDKMQKFFKSISDKMLNAYADDRYNYTCLLTYLYPKQKPKDAEFEDATDFFIKALKKYDSKKSNAESIADLTEFTKKYQGIADKNQSNNKVLIICNYNLALASLILGKEDDMNKFLGKYQELAKTENFTISQGGFISFTASGPFNESEFFGHTIIKNRIEHGDKNIVFNSLELKSAYPPFKAINASGDLKLTAANSSLKKQQIEKDNLLAKNIKDMPGSVTLQDGTVQKGLITMTFISTESAGIVDLDLGKDVMVKGEKINTYRVKKVNTVKLDNGDVYYTTEVKAGAGGKLLNALGGGGSTQFMKVAWQGKKVVVVTDVVSNNKYISILGEEGAYAPVSIAENQKVIKSIVEKYPVIATSGDTLKPLTGNIDEFAKKLDEIISQ